jgi:hypothetical protein
VLKFKVLDDGKIYASYGVNVFRLNPDGTEDTGFDIGTGIGGSAGLFDFDVQNDKVVYGSMFNSYNGIPVNRLVRLNSDGSADSTFDIGSGPDSIVSMVKVLTSGEMIIGGSFLFFNGVAVPHGLVKLGVDGNIDASFIKNQESSALNGFYWFNTKVEQSDTILYIRCMNLFGLDQVIAVNVNGKTDSEFAMPMIVDKINDIILPDDSIKGLKRTKSTLSGDNNSYMFALGNFKYSGISFVMKLAMGNNTVTGDEDYDAGTDKVSLYPMPVNDKLCVSFSEPYVQANLDLFTLSGQHLFSASINSSYGEIDMNSIPAGLYLVKIMTDSGKIFNYKIVKK